MATGWLSHELYFWYDTRSAAGFLPADGRVIEPEAHVESPATKRRFRNLVEVSGLLAELVRLEPRPATEEEILRCHVADYLERIKALSAENGGDAGELTPFGPGGYSSAYVPFCGLAIVEELAGTKSAIDDPYLEVFQGAGGQDLQPHQDAAIAAAEANLSRLAAV